MCSDVCGSKIRYQEYLFIYKVSILILGLQLNTDSEYINNKIQNIVTQKCTTTHYNNNKDE